MEVALAAIALCGTVAGALIWLLKALFNQNNTTLENVVKSSTALAKSIDKLAAAGEKQSAAIERRELADKEWQEYVTRRFDELKEIGETVANKINTQEVVEQTVKHQTVITKE